jgi:hypothetical protein
VIGIDVSALPWAWFAALPGRAASGVLRDPASAPRELRAAASSLGIRDRAVALAIPTRAASWTVLAVKASSRTARLACAAAAASDLGIPPRDVVTSLSPLDSGTLCVYSSREAIEAFMAPWESAGFSVPVVEPAAVSLLRALAGGAPTAILRAGESDIEIVAGSADRLLFSRHIASPWDASSAQRIALEVSSTIESARKEGVAIGHVVVAGHGDVGQIAQALGASPAAAPDEWPGPVPPWAIAAASVALWRRGAGHGPRGLPALAGAERLLAAAARAASSAASALRPPARRGDRR